MITLLLNLIRNPKVYGSLLLFLGPLVITWFMSGSVPDEVKQGNTVKTEITQKLIDNGNVGMLTTNYGEYIFRRDGYVTSTTGQGKYEKYTYFVEPRLRVGVAGWVGIKSGLADFGLTASPGVLFFGYVRPEIAIGRQSAGIGAEVVPFPQAVPGLGIGLLGISGYDQWQPELAPCISYEMRF